MSRCTEVCSISERQRHAAAAKEVATAAFARREFATVVATLRPGNEWWLMRDALEVAVGYKYMRPLAALSVARRFTNVTRLEYAGAIGRPEFALAGQVAARSDEDAIESRRPAWLQSDICDSIRALPRLTHVSLEGVTSLSDSGRRAIRALVASLSPPPVLVE
jgi:hypothetical protein